VQEETKLRAYVSYGRVLPAFRRRGIGGALYRHNMQVLSRAAQQHPQDGPRVAELWPAAGETGLIAMAEKYGYRPTAFFGLMVRPDLENIPDAPMPAGLEVRSALREHYRAIWEADDDAFKDHWGYVPPTEKGYAAFLSDPYFEPALWRVAWAGDQVAGMVRSFINEAENVDFNRQRGWTEYISVRRPWRRMGLARSLLAQSLYVIKERGMTEAALGVHTDNPNGAYQLYEGLGFRLVDRMTVYQKPMELSHGENDDAVLTKHNQ